MLRVADAISFSARFAGCSGGSDGGAGAACGKGANCGGDVVGTWKVAESCAPLMFAASMTGCAGESVQVTSQDFGGTGESHDALAFALDVLPPSTPSSRWPTRFPSADFSQILRAPRERGRLLQPRA
ncbi:MAG TPA: hypothetical protein VKU41_11695 [Polyangiaceae bacterium]|nr:hypothetical protein [Polyangiaceae bacterium]